MLTSLEFKILPNLSKHNLLNTPFQLGRIHNSNIIVKLRTVKIFKASYILCHTSILQVVEKAEQETGDACVIQSSGYDVKCLYDSASCRHTGGKCTWESPFCKRVLTTPPLRTTTLPQMIQDPHIILP
jgi:hypothetical protein